MFFSKKTVFNNIETWAKNFFDVLWQYSGRAFKPAFYVSIETFRKKHFFRKRMCSFHYFRTLSEKYLTSCRKIFDGDVKFAFYVSTENFDFKRLSLEKIKILSKSKLEQKCFLRFVALFREGCQNNILGVRRKSLGQKQFFRKIFFFSATLGCWAKNLRLFVKSFSAEMSKLHLTCRRELFEVNRSSVKDIFLSLLNLEQKTVRFFMEKISADLLKL